MKPLRAQKLNTAKKFVQKKEDEAASVLAAARARLQLHEEQLVQLERYQQEYSDRMVSSGQSWSSVQIQEYRAFISSIDQAIRQQQALILESKTQIEVFQREWMRCRQNKEALGKLVDKIEGLKDAEEALKQQRESDDFASRRLFLK